jgi:hypothetical protein
MRAVWAATGHPIVNPTTSPKTENDLFIGKNLRHTPSLEYHVTSGSPANTKTTSQYPPRQDLAGGHIPQRSYWKALG